MKRILSTSTALSLALAPVQPWPLFAQTMADDGSVIAEDGTVLCTPTAELACDLDAIMKALQAEAEAKAAEAAAAAAQADADAAFAAQAEAEAAAAAAAQGEADAATQKALDDVAAAAAAAAVAAQAEADAAAAVQAEADAAAAVQAEADAAAAAEAAAAEAAAQAEADAAAQKASDDAAAAEAAAAAAAQAEGDAAAQAEADAAAQAEADVAAQKATDDAAAAEAATQADADAAALAEAAAQVDADAQAEADAVAQAEAEAAAAIKEPVELDAAAIEAAAAEDAAAAERAAQAAADAQAAAEAEAVALTEVEQAAAQAAAADAAAAQAAADEAAAAAAVAAEEAAKVAAEAVASGNAEEAAAAEDVARSAKGDAVEAAAKAAEEAALVQTLTAVTVPVEPVDEPVAQDTAIEALTDLLAAPAADAGSSDVAVAVAAAETLLSPTAATDPAADPDKAPIDVLTTLIEAQNTRSSVQEFGAAPVRLKSGKKSGLSDLEKVGLIALGALVVGAILRDGRQVVSNSGDRVVVRDPQGGYQVYKDDDTLLRRPGSTVRTETYRDGSTRTVVERDNGTQVVTIRDASGRVIRRASYDRRGNEIMLIDDFIPEERIIITDLPRPRRNPVTISTRDGDAALKAALAAEDAERIGRKFSLRQIRDIPQVRALAATIDAERITFDSGSSVIRATEARKLADLGRTMGELLEDNPAELFLIEGHTDAVGSAASNLALSDRRAESVALALSEYFDVPPENMVVQGYGEGELLIETDADERLNRRVGVRLISPLMLRTASR